MYTIEEYFEHDLEEKRYVVIDSDGYIISSEHMTFEDAQIELIDCQY